MDRAVTVRSADLVAIMAAFLLRLPTTEQAWAAAALEHVAAVQNERDELRAILAPLLDHPIAIDGQEQAYCIFCDSYERGGSLAWDVEHKPDCPVLRRDALMGRS